MNNKAQKSNPKISYEPEADVLRVEISPQPIDYAQEIGNFVVHFTRDGLPVYLEILDASKFKQITEKAFARPAEALSLNSY